MAYLTEEDIKIFTGFSASDFKQDGAQMTATQFTDLCGIVIDAVTESINRFCNVDTLEEHVATEYFNGKRATTDEGAYNEADLTYYLRENCSEVSTVSVDMTPGDVITWQDRTLRTGSVAGDYEVHNRMGLTYVRIIKNIPAEGINNVRIVYTAGYEDDSEELKNIKVLSLRMASNLLLIKKKMQEATTIRAAATEDYAKMFELAYGKEVMTPEIAAGLMRYKRWFIEPWSL